MGNGHVLGAENERERARAHTTRINELESGKKLNEAAREKAIKMREKDRARQTWHTEPIQNETSDWKTSAGQQQKKNTRPALY